MTPRMRYYYKNLERERAKANEYMKRHYQEHRGDAEWMEKRRARNRKAYHENPTVKAKKRASQNKRRSAKNAQTRKAYHEATALYRVMTGRSKAPIGQHADEIGFRIRRNIKNET